MADREIRVADNLWIKGSLVSTLVAGGVSGTLLYSNIKYELEEGRKALTLINETVIREVRTLREEKDRDISQIKEGITDVRLDIQKITVGFMQARQADTWILVFRENVKNWRQAFETLNPSTKIPDLSVPDLPK